MAFENVPVAAGKNEDARKINVQYDFGSNLEEAVAKFGAETVFSSFKAAAKVDLQALVRRKLNATVETGKGEDGVVTTRPVSDEEIIASVASWRPDAREARVAKSKTDKALEIIGEMDEAAKQALIEQLMAALGQ